MIRRFVNIVAENYRTSVYSLHRLDASERLFYPSTAEAHASRAAGDESEMMETMQKLPSPWFRIGIPPDYPQEERFMTPIFGLINSHGSESRILRVDKGGYTLVADADLGGVGPVPVYKSMPTLKCDKGFDPILISIAPPDAAGEEDLYVMSRTPRRTPRRLLRYSSCFDVLRCGTSGELRALGCQWQPLPPPPFVEEPRYDSYGPVHICSHAVVDGANICVSFDGGVGTYCFDTVQRAWSHVGDWVLPFEGGAEHDPDLNFWLGFSSKNPNHLCWTSELNKKPMKEPEPSELQHILKGFVTPENWLPMSSRLIKLGSGRFCIAKLFQASNNSALESCGVEWDVAVLMGVEILGGSEGPEVLKHKSLLYQPMDHGIKWVL